MATDFTTSFISSDRGMEDIYTDKQAVWDAIVEEYPMMAYSPIFKEGFDQWNAGGGIPQNLRNILGPIINKASKIVTGDSAVGTGYGSHINIQPPEHEGVTERDTHALVGHEISHLGMKTGLGFNKEEKLARMHDRMYQPSSYLGTQVAVPYLMDQGYIEQTNIPGGLSYVGDPGGNYGTQHTNRGNEFIRESRLPQHQQRTLGYVEPSRSTNQAPVRRTPTRDPNEGRHHFNEGGIAGLPWGGGQWSSSVIEGDEEIYDIKPLQMDPGIMSIDDLEDLFEEVGLDKRLIYNLINTGGLSQLVA